MKSENSTQQKRSPILLAVSLVLLLLAAGLLLYPYLRTTQQMTANQKAALIVEKNATPKKSASEKRRQQAINQYNQLVVQQQQANQIGGTNASRDRLALVKKFQPQLHHPLGFVTVPAIKMSSMPFYYGDDDWALTHGAGLLPWTSIPNGRRGTLAEITGHTGMSQVFFDNIRYLKKGDLIYVTAFDQEFAYKVTGRVVLDPNQPSSIRTSYAQKNQDQIALMTCTPRFINNRRLVIYARRTKLKQAKHRPVQIRSQWTPESIMALLSIIPLLAIIVILWLWWRNRRKDRDQDE
ncbi:class C sortase [Lapidilactobacillus wuchangensis]|uniref:class C sortase n=1 Tax=Lapidilactobacillus wuchangensis TaxID=2486001 RepID=UPI000F77A6A2|nr:class C sortase [Lapidilactobacillus wuchangensis]